jgi:hypothetical protein
VTLGTEPGCWTTPTSQTAVAAAIHMDGFSQGDVESAPQSLTTNDSQSLITKEGVEALDVTPEGSSLSSEEKKSLEDVPKKINEPRNITTPTTATKVRAWIDVKQYLFDLFSSSLLHLLKTSLTPFKNVTPLSLCP